MIFTAEVVVMLVLQAAPPMSARLAAAMDAFLLLLLLAPTLYMFLFRPLTERIAERAAATLELQQAHDELEQRIQERTAELASANRSLEESLQATERGRRELSLVGDVIELLQTCQTMAEAEETLRRFGREAFPNMSGAVYQYLLSPDLLEVVAEWGEGPRAARSLKPDDCWALRRGRRHIETQGSRLTRCRHFKDARLSAAICVPLTLEGETTGVLLLYSDAEQPNAEKLSESAQSLTALAAERVALALANLQLRGKLRDQAIRDLLTGLYNRRYFEETLDRELRRAERHGTPLSLIMLDVDHFKRFNDRFGHDAGDLVLKHVGGALKKSIRGEDIACRYGGDEFVLLLADAPIEAAAARAEELKDAITELVLKHRGEALGSIAVSCGVASFPGNGAVREDLVAAADQAMYRAKGEGRDHVALATIAPSQ